MQTIGVHTHITNPYSSGYLCYLAAIKSWARLADHVVVVDGGSSDGSCECLYDWLGPIKAKVQVISPPEAHWGPDDLWEWPQIAINRQAGLEALETDWAIHIDADHLAYVCNRDRLLNELEKHTEAILLSLPVIGYNDGQFIWRKTPRAWVLNLKKIRSLGLQVAYGIDRIQGTHLDYPVSVMNLQGFIDPDNNSIKQFYWGEPLSNDGILEFALFKIGHFSFKIDQCLKKCMRIERAIGRFCNRMARSRFEIHNELGLHKIIGSEKREELLIKPFPKEVTELIRNFYTDEMMGGLLYRPLHKWKDLWRRPVCSGLEAARRIQSTIKGKKASMMNSVERASILETQLPNF